MDRIRITMFDISLMSLRNVRASFNCSARMSLDSLTRGRSEEHTSELQSHLNLVCRLLLEKKKSQYFYLTSKKTINLHIQLIEVIIFHANCYSGPLTFLISAPTPLSYQRHVREHA